MFRCPFIKNTLLCHKHSSLYNENVNESIKTVCNLCYVFKRERHNPHTHAKPTISIFISDMFKMEINTFSISIL